MTKDKIILARHVIIQVYVFNPKQKGNIIIVDALQLNLY